MGTVDWWALLVVLVLICQACQAHSAAPHGSARAGSGVVFGAVPEQAWGYRRFHANDSLIGRPVPCTRHEKLCFQYNLLFHPLRKICLPINLFNFGDRQVFLNGSGNLRAAVFDDNLCEGEGGSIAAYDGVCYKKELYSEVLCRCNSTLSFHILGGVECRCVPPEPLFVEQPPENGRCRIPDLRFPNTMREHFFRSPYDEIQGFRVKHPSSWSDILDYSPRLSCSPQQQQCFSQEKLWLEGNCFPLLERGPCPQEHVVALGASAAANGFVEATCVHVRGGCPPREVLAAFDGFCHLEDDLRVTVPAAKFHQNQFGVFVATPVQIQSMYFTPSIEQNEGKLADTCFIHVIFQAAGAAGVPVATPQCATNDKGVCSVEVIAEPPPPEL